MHTLTLFKHSIWRPLLIAAVVGMSALLVGLFTVNLARAHSDPGGCSSTGPALLLGVFAADGVTPVFSASPGDTLYYKATLTHVGPPQCNYEGGDLDITLPDGSSVDVDGGVIPLVSFGSPFVSSLAPYPVDSADVGGDGDLDASAIYAGGTSHFGEADVSPVGATTPIATPFVKLDSTVTTEVHDPAHADITSATVAAGTTVHDEATVSGSGPTPTGTSTIVLFGNGSCDAAGIIDGDIYPLVGGMAESIDYVALAPGSYSFLASYAGDANYNGDDGICEPFTIVAPLVVEKTVETSYDRDWDWTINKSADQTNLLLAEGESFTVNYEVTVTPSSEDINHSVTGTITITNPVGNPVATVLSVSDVLNVSGAAVVVCPGDPGPYIIAPGGFLVCTYTKGAASPSDTENEATVITDGGVPGGSDTALVSYGAPSNVTDECVTVNDTNSGFPGPDVVICENTTDKTIEYSVTFGPEGGEGVDVPVACGEIDHPNTANFITNDNQEIGQDNWNVHVTVECDRGCTLTQGYWKTHSDQGPAPFDDNWDNLPDVDGDTVVEAESETFFLSGATWYTVFWTAPKGNAYYQLAHQYMAAVLNILNGATAPTAVTDAIADAEADIFSMSPSDFAALGKKDPLRSEAITLTGILGSFNEGLTGPGHCDEQNPV